MKIITTFQSHFLGSSDIIKKTINSGNGSFHMKKIITLIFVLSLTSVFATKEKVDVILEQDQDLVTLTKCVTTDSDKAADCKIMAEVVATDKTNVDQAVDELATIAEKECQRSCNFITKGYNDTKSKIRNNKVILSVRIISFYTYLAIKQAITGDLQAVRF
jgi:hypothetical protein